MENEADYLRGFTFARYNYISAVFLTNTSIKAEHTETLGMLRLFLQQSGSYCHEEQEIIASETYAAKNLIWMIAVKRKYGDRIGLLVTLVATI